MKGLLHLEGLSVPSMVRASELEGRVPEGLLLSHQGTE